MPIVKAYSLAELFPTVRAGAAWDFDATGTLVQAPANTPRVDYDPATLAARGVLVEQQAVNALANPRLQDAAAGSPGTPPSGFGFISTTGAGVTRTIALGSISGASFVDFVFAGTATAANLVLIDLDALGALPCVAGETASGALYVTIFGAGLPTSALLRLREWNASVFSATDIALPLTASAGALLQSRISATRTFTNPSTTDARLSVICLNSVSQALNFTVRIAAPQLWKAGVAFSPSFPPAGTPGPSTRAADDITSVNARRWLNRDAGTFVVEFVPGQAAAASPRGLVTLDDGTTANRIRLRMLAGATTVRLSADVAGVEVAGIEQASGAALVRHTARFSYGPAGWLLSLNGAAPVSAAGALPAGLVRALLGRGAAAADYLNGWIGPRFAYYPVQYTDAPAADGFTIRTR